MRRRKFVSSSQHRQRKRRCIARDIWIVSGAIMIVLLQNPVLAPAAIIVFLLALFGVLMFLDESSG